MATIDAPDEAGEDDNEGHGKEYAEEEGSPQYQEEAEEEGHCESDAFR